MKMLFPAPVALAAALYLPTADQPQDTSATQPPKPPAVEAEGATALPQELDKRELLLRTKRAELEHWRKRLELEQQGPAAATAPPASPAKTPETAIDERQIRLLELRHRLEFEQGQLNQARARFTTNPRGEAANPELPTGPASGTSGIGTPAPQIAVAPTMDTSGGPLAKPHLRKAARALIAQKKYEDAHRLLLRANEPGATFQAALCLERLGRTEEAVRLYAQIATQDPDSRIGLEAERMRKFLLSIDEVSEILADGARTLEKMKGDRQ